MLEFYPNINSGLMQGQCETVLQTSLNCNGRTDVGTIKCEKNYEICEGCGLKIQDRYLMRVTDTSWHEQCLQCCICGCALNHTCFVRNSKLYCKDDYNRLYSHKCARCGDPILPQNMVMRAQQYIFHQHCFCCYSCHEPLHTGEEYFLRSGQIICKHHVESYLSHYNDDYSVGEELIRHKDGRRGPKRPRTILTSAQRRQFKSSFEVSPKPCRKIREALAKDTGLSVRVVQVWFQNQRAKMKKIQRKSKQDGDKNSDKDGMKDEKGIKQESPSSDHGHYLGVDSSFSSSSQPLNPNNPYSPEEFHTNSDYSSDLSLDGSFVDQIDDGCSDTMSLANLDLHSTHVSNDHININPIDKLYLMQNSYFHSEQ